MSPATSYLTLMREVDDPAGSGHAPDGRVVHPATLSDAPAPTRYDAAGRVLGLVADLVDAPDGAAGLVSAGVVEAAVAVLRAARDSADVRAGSTASVVLPESAHPAYFTAAATVGLVPVVVPVDAEGRADVGTMVGAIRADTVLVVASAASYTHGTTDPVAWIAAAAQAHGLPLHVDATSGGWAMAHAERTGRVGPTWGFAIRGVASVSVDVGPVGGDDADLVVVLHREPAGARGLVTTTASPARGPLAMPSAWARPGALLADTVETLQDLGPDGCARLAADALAATAAVVDGVLELRGVRLAARPDATVLTLQTDATCDVLTLADALHVRGWSAQVVLPESGLPLLRLPVTAATLPVVGDLLAALADAVAEAQERGRAGLDANLVRLLERFEPPVGGYSADLLLDAAAMADGPERHATTHLLVAAARPGVRESLLAVHQQRLTRPVRPAQPTGASSSTEANE